MATAYGSATKARFEVPELDDNYYRAQIADIRDSVSKFNGESQPQCMIKFDLLDEQKENGEPVNLFGFIRIPDGVINDGTLNEKSKLYEFLLALGYTDDNLEIEPDSWQGQQLRIQVKNKTIESGDNKGQTRPAVVGYSPLKQARKAAQATERRSPAARPAPAAATAGDGDGDDENDF